MDLGFRYKDMVSFIIENMSQFCPSKQSEANDIIFLANFSRPKNTMNGKATDAVGQIETIIRNSTKSSFFMRKESKKSSRKIVKIIKKKLTKRFLNHTDYLRESVQELKSMPLSESLQISKLFLDNCVKNTLIQ